MGVLLNAVNKCGKIKRGAPVEKKREIVLAELKAMNVTHSRVGTPIEKLDYEALKEEWVFASIMWVDIECPANKYF